MTAKVIAFINYKGGVAKTTTTYHIGCSLAQHFNKRVLFVDIDPQTNLTFLCASIQDWENFKKTNGTIATMYRRFLEKKSIDTKRYIWRQPVGAALKKRIGTLDLIPCDIDLIGEDFGRWLGCWVISDTGDAEAPVSRVSSRALLSSARIQRGRGQLRLHPHRLPAEPLFNDTERTDCFAMVRRNRNS
jgi:cellulose biosynthesis protein BcsQ